MTEVSIDTGLKKRIAKQKGGEIIFPTEFLERLQTVPPAIIRENAKFALQHVSKTLFSIANQLAHQL